MVGSADDLRAALADRLQPADAQPGAIVPYSGAAKKIIELCAREALRLGHDEIATEHLLLAVLADEQLPAARVLAERDVTHAIVETHVRRAHAAE
jgi:ATP-dependent Clp protease ATP-binding subunit ClpA